MSAGTRAFFTGWVVIASCIGDRGDVLQQRPFSTREGRAKGIERWHLRSPRWQRVGPAIYAPASRIDHTMVRLEAAASRVPAAAAFAGLSAAWLHGLDVDGCSPIEMIVPKGNKVSGRAGMRVYRSALPEAEATAIQGLKVTNILRTLEDIGRRLSLTEATVIVDAALQAGLIEISRFDSWARSRRGGRGLVNLRAVAGAAEPKSESPMETRLRMALVIAGLPRPEAQVPIYDERGLFVGRPDLYYSDCKLGIEYDGGFHRESLPEDNRRQNRLLEAGVTLLRFTAADVLSRPATVVAQVRAVRASAGTRDTKDVLSGASAGTRGVA